MQKKQGLGFLLGKYREIMLAVAFFLVFDLAVLVLNFYIANQLSGDAQAINLAGRQRMLSQRITKTVLQIHSSAQAEKPHAALDEELKTATHLFGETLQAFNQGGTVSDASGQSIVLKAVAAADNNSLLNEANTRWETWEAVLAPMLNQRASNAQIEEAVQVLTSSNVAMLKDMNALTVHLEKVAQAQASKLRLTQTIGIVLALINFMFILFKFIRKLRESDAQVESAQQETSEILATVQEGLCLMDSEFKIGSQFSKSLSGILGCQITSGDNFLLLLRSIAPEHYESAKDYLSLLLEGRVKENLVRSLNPLTEVAIQTKDRNIRYLAMQFNRVSLHQQNDKPHLLITIQDVTQRVQLEDALLQAKQHGSKELKGLLHIFSKDQTSIRHFFACAMHILEDINLQLKNADQSSYARIIAHISREIHGLKGEAGALELEWFEMQLHEFEQILLKIRTVERLSGEDLLGLLPHLDTLFQRLEQILNLFDMLKPKNSAPPTQQLKAMLGVLCERVAVRQNKAVRLNIQQFDEFETLNETQQNLIKGIAVQCIRNAIVHGIESPNERNGKAPIGQIAITLKKIHAGQFQLEISDDGRGIDPNLVRASLLEKGLFNAAQLADMSDTQVVMQIFTAGFSTQEKGDEDAGQGVGLDVVQENIRALGGHLRLASKPQQFTTFNIQFFAHP